MRSTLKTGLIVLLCLFWFQAEAQKSGLFDSFDCRKHAEVVDPELLLLAEILALDPIIIPDLPPEEIIAPDTLEDWESWSYVQNYTFGKDRGGMVMITDLRALHPYFRDRVTELLKACKEKGIELAIVETYRTHAKQFEYKSMGRKYTSSGAGRSKHQYGLAIDVVPIIDSVAVWDNPALWRKVGVVGEKLGLRWGGRWRKPYDPGHFEWTGGLSTTHLVQGVLPVVPAAPIHYPCLEEDLTLLRKYWTEWENSQSSLTRK